MGLIAQNIFNIRQKIADAAKRTGRDAESVTLIAVSKTVDAKMAVEALEAGCADLGESRVQEARAKFKEIGSKAVWHMIGSLQTNKAKYIPGLFSLVHSIDRLELIKELGARALLAGVIVEGLLQVNVSGEESKRGCEPSEAARLLKACSVERGVKIKGLMTVAPYCEDIEEARPVYRGLMELKADLFKEGIEEVSLDIISAGMSNDFEVAVEEGATMVRVGSRIFGERIYG